MPHVLKNGREIFAKKQYQCTYKKAANYQCYQSHISNIHPMSKTEQLIQRWRGLSPADWEESEYGWILPSGRSIILADWQRAVLHSWYANPNGSTLAVSAPRRSARLS